MNDYKKITVPANVANAIAHYVNLADSKHEAFTDILSLGYEAERSEIILRHFDGDYDELMEALICGYEVEKSPEERVRQYYENLDKRPLSHEAYGWHEAKAIRKTLDLLGITISGVNAR